MLGGRRAAGRTAPLRGSLSSTSARGYLPVPPRQAPHHPAHATQCVTRVRGRASGASSIHARGPSLSLATFPPPPPFTAHPGRRTAGPRPGTWTWPGREREREGGVRWASMEPTARARASPSLSSPLLTCSALTLRAVSVATPTRISRLVPANPRKADSPVARSTSGGAAASAPRNADPRIDIRLSVRVM